MAVNIAAPICGLVGLSPTSPIAIDCWENIKLLVSPVGSESSGVSSLDSEEANPPVKETSSRKPETIQRNLCIYYNGRNVLDLYNNLETSSTNWKFRYSYLPQRNNIAMFWANRSLYNRLGPDGLTPVYTINKCECCDFQYTSDCPDSSYSTETSLNLSPTTTSSMIFTTAFNKNLDYHTTIANATTNTTLAVYQESLQNHKSAFEMSNKQLYNQTNIKTTKLNDLITKKNNFPNINSNYNNINRNTSLGGTMRSDMSQLVTNIVTSNISASPSNTPTTNMMIGYSKNTVHHKNCNPMDVIMNSSNSYAPQIYLNASETSSSITPMATIQSLHDSSINSNNFNRLSQRNVPNKIQICSSNNMFSLFTLSNTNNGTLPTFNASTNTNASFNTLNSINNLTNNINVNPIIASSPSCGRVYKYF